MKAITRNIAVAITAAIAATGGAFADSLWSVGGPEAGNVTALASAPPSAVVYAATLDGGVWKSVDSGAHWSHASNGLPTALGSFVGIDSLAVDPVNPAIAYAGYFAKGIYRTTDGGSSWNTAGTGIPSSASVEAIAVDPTAVAIVLAGTSNGVYRSSDHGATFTPTTGMPGIRVISLAIDASAPLSVLAGTNFSGLYISFDGGLSWVKNTGTDLDSEQIRAVFFDAADDSTVFIGGVKTIYKGVKQNNPSAAARASANTPESSSIRPDIYIPWFLYFNPVLYLYYYDSLMLEMKHFFTGKSSLAVEPVPIYVGTEGGGIYVSTNGGSNFAQSNAGLPSLTIEALADEANAVTCGSADLGIARSTDGSHWSASNAGFIASEVQALAVSRTSPATVVAGTSGALYESVDAGVSWTLLGGTTNLGGVGAVAVDPGNAAIVYAAAGDGGVIKSTNGGTSWSAIGLDSAFVSALAIDPSAGSTIWAGASDGVHKTTDGGAHWALANPNDSIPSVRALAIDPVAPSTVYAGTDGSGIFRTTDGGAHWANISSSQSFVNSGTVAGLAVDPSSHANLYAATSNGAWKTGNGGTAWTEINDGLEIDFNRPTLRAIAISAGSPSTIYVGSTGAFGSSAGTGVYKSTNAGTSWSPVNDGLSNTDVQALAVSSGASPVLYAGTLGGGVFRSPPTAPAPPPGGRRIIPVHPAPPGRTERPR